MRGIIVEPSEVMCRLHQLYRPKDIHICAGVGEADRLSKFLELSYHGRSTFSEEKYIEDGKAGAELTKVTFKPIFKISTILRYCIPKDRTVFALLSVDAEGWDYVVLQSNNWDAYRPLIIIVEQIDEDSRNAIFKYLTDREYLRIATLGCNTVYKLID